MSEIMPSTPYILNHLTKYSTLDLQRACKETGLNYSGDTTQLTKRIVEAGFVEFEPRAGVYQIGGEKYYQAVENKGKRDKISDDAFREEIQRDADEYDEHQANYHQAPRMMASDKLRKLTKRTQAKEAPTDLLQEILKSKVKDLPSMSPQGQATLKEDIQIIKAELANRKKTGSSTGKITYYRCSNCGYLARNKDSCPACSDSHQKKLGTFASIEDAMVVANRKESIREHNQNVRLSDKQARISPPMPKLGR